MTMMTMMTMRRVNHSMIGTDSGRSMKWGGGDVDYIDVEWRDDLPSEPVRLVSELDAQRELLIRRLAHALA